MSEFKCVTSTISTIKEVLDEVQRILENTYSQALNVQTALTDSNNWNGSAQLVGAAFLDLVVQYHALLAGDGEGPVAQASKALQKYLDCDAVFYDEWIEYQDIMNI